MNEIKPKFPPKVQAIWDSCGTHVTSIEAEQGAKEIEFFVETLLGAICDSHLYHEKSTVCLEEVLIKEGYVGYERK